MKKHYAFLSDLKSSAKSLIVDTRSPNRSLSSELSFIIMLLSIPIFVLSLGFLLIHSSNSVRQEATERATSVLNTTLTRISLHMNAVETATNLYGWEVLENLQPDSLLAISHRVVRLNPHIDGCSISTEPNVFPQIGRYFSVYTIREDDSVKTVVEEQYEYFEKVWYKKPKDQKEACWVDYYDEADSLELTLDGMLASYSKPLYNTEGDLVAIISTDLSLTHLSKIFAAERPYPNSYFMMLGEEGRYFIHPDSTLLFTHTIFSDADPKRQADVYVLGHEMTSGSIGNMTVDLNGKTCQVCFQPVPGTPWSLAIVCPESDILGSYYRLLNIIIGVIILGLLFIVLLCHMAVASAVKPISQLLSKTQSITAGNYEIHIPKSKREDAIGDLQNSFGRMLQSLNFQMGSIRYATEQTEHRNEELMKATKLAEEAGKQKTLFIQNMSHQIRTPLNIIMGFAQVLREYEGQLPEMEMKSIAATMKHNTMSLTRMVNMLLDCSVTELGKTEEKNMYNLKEVKCNSVARAAIGSVQSYHPDMPIAFNTELSDDYCIYANPLYLMRSLRELLYNSAKYSDRKHVSVSIVKTDDSIRFTVENTGDVISEADRDRMFEPFTKVDDLSEGLGLGLPLSKNRIRSMGGELTLDADYHDGCRFIIELPICQERRDNKE